MPAIIQFSGSAPDDAARIAAGFALMGQLLADYRTRQARELTATAFEASAGRIAAMRETEAARVAEQHTTSPWKSRASQLENA